MRARLRYFARIRELVGKAEEEIELPEGYTAGGILESVKNRYTQLKDLKNILVAVNGEHVDHGAPLAEGDVVALFPPVSGG
jgi:molybdopterin synthase sulfur carrier subunit